jgi:hypothetical protein
MTRSCASPAPHPTSRRTLHEGEEGSLQCAYTTSLHRSYSPSKMLVLCRRPASPNLKAQHRQAKPESTFLPPGRSSANSNRRRPSSAYLPVLLPLPLRRKRMTNSELDLDNYPWKASMRNSGCIERVDEDLISHRTN